MAQRVKWLSDANGKVPKGKSPTQKGWKCEMAPCLQRIYNGDLNPPQLKLNLPTPSREAASIWKYLGTPVSVQHGT